MPQCDCYKPECQTCVANTVDSLCYESGLIGMLNTMQLLETILADRMEENGRFVVGFSRFPSACGSGRTRWAEGEVRFIITCLRQTHPDWVFYPSLAAVGLYLPDGSQPDGFPWFHALEKSSPFRPK